MQARGRVRRGGAMLWTVAGLAVAVAMTPLCVSLCHSLSRVTARGGHRLLATQAGTAELERLRTAGGGAREFAVPELPEGRGVVTLAPAPSPKLRQATVTVTWSEGGAPARAEWTTLLPAPRPAVEGAR